MTDISSQSSAVDAAYQSGRRVGLATAAVALGFVSFLNLLGMEKSILALVLAILAMRGAVPLPTLRRRSLAAIALAVLHLLTVITVLILFKDELAELVRLLYELN